ncbi:type VI secretion system membrane subunit TssM [Pseudomonas soli]|uniref:type VI secretion system membrane subunit TssM n=1 Tax=Pseudomonas soli TaxID=1306993 RepID=UPI003DA7B471
MSKLWALFKRWGLPQLSRTNLAMPLLLGAGLVLLLMMIWWLGPQWTWREQQPLASLAQRSIATLLLVLLPLLAWLFVLRSRYRRLQAERQQDTEASADPILPYVLAQTRALDAVLACYLEHAGGHGALYRLPWYLLLGDEGAGKSSLMGQSIQRFSLTRINKVQAQGRQEEAQAYPVDWWISDDAVIIDPPGALMTRQAGAGDLPKVLDRARPVSPAGTQARLWMHLLDWLAQKRSRNALNGIVLVVDLPALQQAKPAQRQALAQVLRARLHEVSSRLGARLPVYVVLSKFDLLDGFEQLFARLTETERECVFGFTFKLAAVNAFDAWLDELAEQYDWLVGRTQAQVLDDMGGQGKADLRERLVSLLGQLRGLRPVLLAFLREVLASDRFTTPALVRGLYLSSMLQRGQVYNAFLHTVAHPFQADAPPREGKPQGKQQVFFTQRLFQQVVYPEAGLAGDNVRVARDKRRLLWVGSAVGGLALVVVGSAWHRYFDANSVKALSVLGKSRAFSSHEVDQRLDPTGRNLLAPMDQIRDAVTVFGDYRRAWPVVADLGLYQGRAVGPLVDDAYLGLLARRFLPAIASGVVDAMNAAPAGSEQQMAALRVYRMIEDRHNRRPEWVEQWMTRHWQAAFPGQGQLQGALMRHLRYALAYADTELPQFRQRVGAVQQSLREVPMAQRVYASLRQQAQEQLHTGLDLRHEVGPAFDTVFQATSRDAQGYADLLMAPLLTAKGFNDYYLPRSAQITELAMVDQWALGERRQLDYSAADREVLQERIGNLYNADYIDSWRRALNDLEITDFRDLDHGVSVLGQLTGPAQPLRRLLESVRENTAMAAAQNRTAALDVVGVEADQQLAGIRRAFSSLSDLLQARGENPSYYDETLSAIAAVHDHARGVQGSPDRGNAALQAVLQRFSMTGPDPIAALQRVATGLPEPIGQQLRKVADQTAQVLVVEALRELERRWDADVYSFFQQRLAARYPFTVRGPDASLDDFESFFGPKGRLQVFQERYLNVFLKDNLDALYADSHGGSLVRSEVIEQLAAAERIRETFFDQRGNLGVQFSVEPLGLSANQRTSLLDLDGQLVSYTHGPTQITGVIWPNTLGQQVRSNLTLLRLNGNSSSLEYRGPWSMFRLLSRGALNGRTATAVDLSFKTGDGVMRYRLSSEKAFNPITQQPFKDFRLPRSLLQPAIIEAPHAI